ncbi:MAG: aldo/keto reductase [Patescibacteria group bacterium]
MEILKLQREREVLSVLKTFNTDYIDTFQFTSSVFYEFGFDRCVEFVNKMISKGIFRYTSITNENLDLLKKYHEFFKDKLISHEVGYNFEVRENEIEGTIPYANLNNIKTVIFQPLRRNRTAMRNWPLLVELAQKYGKSQNQIILAWLISKGFLPLTKSESIDHINEYIDVLNFELDAEDLNRPVAQ